MLGVADLIVAKALVMVLAVRLTQANVSVAPVLGVTVSVLLAAAGVSYIITHRGRVGAVHATVMAALTAAIVTATVSATKEAVVMLAIAHLVVSIAEGVVSTHTKLTLMARLVAFIVVRTVGIVLQTSTAWLALAGGGIAIVAVATVRVAGVLHVAHPIKHVALHAVPAAAHVVTAAGWVRVWTVYTVSSNSRTASHTQSSVTERTCGFLVWSWDIANTIKVVTFRVLAALTDSIILAGKGHCAVAIGTLVTIRILAAFMLLKITNNSALNVGWPVTHGAERILVARIECQRPLAIAQRVGGASTVSTLHQAGLAIRSTHPEPAAVC